MCLLWTAVAITMLHWLKLLKAFLSVYLNRQQGLALLERVHASNLSDADRALVTRIMRAALQLPEAPGHEPSSPEAPAPTAHPHAVVTDTRLDLIGLDKSISHRYTCRIASLVACPCGVSVAKDAWCKSPRTT